MSTYRIDGFLVFISRPTKSLDKVIVNVEGLMNVYGAESILVIQSPLKSMIGARYIS